MQPVIYNILPNELDDINFVGGGVKKSPKQALTTNDTHELDVRSLFAMREGGMPGPDFACQGGCPRTSWTLRQQRSDWGSMPTAADKVGAGNHGWLISSLLEGD